MKTHIHRETLSIPPPPSNAPVASPTPEGPESNSVEESSAQTNGPNPPPTIGMRKWIQCKDSHK